MQVVKIQKIKKDIPVEVFDIQVSSINDPTFICEGVVVHNSDICINLDNRYWIYDFPEKSTLPYEIYVPGHMRCRSTNPPITKSWQELGLDPNNLTEADKEYLSGTIPERETYFQWFEKQNESTKKEILGKTRYNAYKNGNMKIEQFYNNGERVSINELREKGLNI